jgi:selenocysteine lyase/cysteine desulfurase
VTSSYNAPRPEFTLKPTAERWEGGSFAMPGHQGFASSVELILELGPAAVSARILDRAERVRELARSCGWTVAGSTRPADLSGIVPLEKAGVSPDAVARVGRSRGVVLSARRGRVRVSPHVYNDDDDLERLAELLRNP